MRHALILLALATLAWGCGDDSTCVVDERFDPELCRVDLEDQKTIEVVQGRDYVVITNPYAETITVVFEPGSIATEVPPFTLRAFIPPTPGEWSWQSTAGKRGGLLVR